MFMHVVHDLDPLFDEHSKVLILGSFPSVQSRGQFFYNHPQNRFWKVLASVTGRKIPVTVDEKKEFLLGCGIALWDVIGECDISGSSDSSIRNVIPNDISIILNAADIREIFANGSTAFKYYKKYILPETGRSAVCLPSTSPANAAYSLDRLTESWRIVTESLA